MNLADFVKSTMSNLMYNNYSKHFPRGSSIRFHPLAHFACHRIVLQLGEPLSSSATASTATTWHNTFSAAATRRWRWWGWGAKCNTLLVYLCINKLHTHNQFLGFSRFYLAFFLSREFVSKYLFQFTVFLWLSNAIKVFAHDGH